MICGKLLMIHQNLNNFTLFQSITIQGAAAALFSLRCPKNFLKMENFLRLKIEKTIFKALELSKHWSLDSTPARDEVIMKTTYPVNQ